MSGNGEMGGETNAEISYLLRAREPSKGTIKSMDVRKEEKVSEMIAGKKQKKKGEKDC